MAKQDIFALADLAAEAQAKIQQNYAHVNPVIHVRHGLRQSGFPADALTIDCLQTHKRILIILHDEQLDEVQYQFSRTDQDPTDDYSISGSTLEFTVPPISGFPRLHLKARPTGFLFFYRIKFNIDFYDSYIFYI